MESINELLRKYFNGETSIEEEQTLKKYFKSDKVEIVHEIYRSLFQVFKEEREVTYPADNDKYIDSGQHRTKQKWLKIISISGVAATVLLAFWFLQINTETADFVMIKGKKINDTEYAQQIAQSKLDKIHNVLEKSLNPIQSINKVKESLKPVKKLSEVKSSLDNIENKLNFK